MPRPPGKMDLRHWLLQGVLCAILAGTLGLAMLVKRHRLALINVPFEGLTEAGPFRLQYPRGWELRPTQQGAVVLEPGEASEGQRRTEILYVPSVGFISPLELLVRLDWLDERDAAVLPTLESKEGAGGLKPLRIAGWPGVLISMTRHYAAGRDGGTQHRKQTLACTVLPSGDGIVMRLDGKGMSDASDEHLIVRLAGSLSLSDRPEVQRRGELELGDGLKVSLPEGLGTNLTADPFRTGRVLVAENAPHWLAVELVPCLMTSAADGAEAAFAAMMALRDPYVRWKAPQRLDGHTWVCERARLRGAEAESETAFPARAYLRTTPGGHALLAEFRWVPASAGAGAPLQPESFWSAVAAAMEFPARANLDPLVEAGGRAVRTLPADAVEVLNTRPEEQWQWYHGATPRSSSATLRYDADGGFVGGEAESNRSPPLSASGWEIRRWRLWRDWTRYYQQITRMMAGTAFSYETRVEGKLIFFRVWSGEENVSSAQGARSAIFVPGPILPLVLGRLKPEPMVLQTDTIPSPLTSTSVGLLTLRLEPAGDVPKLLPDGEGPMTCWSVRINGSGQSSRWYFDRNNRLQSISFAGDVHFQRVEDESGEPATQPTTREAGADQGNAASPLLLRPPE